MEITFRNVVLVSMGGAVGAPLRFLVSFLIVERLNGPTFPVATLTVNVIGSFLLAFVTWVAGERLGLTPSVRLLVGTGLLGAFTTYSTFSVETILLIERGKTPIAFLYVILTAVFALLAAYLGMRAGRLV